ncbi:DUF1612 domain-containing protein [Rhodomicrobium vannielii ATCC 17100]|uniref:DUF1612 domain-containing protein n=1 Tax=Rhodomicrobium vannielii TaxID=1069 RepID=UPI0019188A48|nr:DUF1612 domain-containing protein [Rhodomicrobium vannielii]MBJ7532955.1 DUF1612 domain-containing protein [Rhodomicrobium vannielii ATCC 17100]
MQYSIPSPLPLEAFLGPLLRAEDALARFDERLRGSPKPLAEGFCSRILFHEICAEQRLEGLLVHLEDLALFAAGAFDGPTSPELSAAHEALQLWRRAAKAKASPLLLSPRPGETVSATEPLQNPPEFFFDPDWNEPARLAVWRGVLHESRNLPPVLAAALAWDAWLFAQPDQRGAWRAPLIAALVLKARKKTEAFLLPLALGRRPAEYRDAGKPFEVRIEGFCGLVVDAVQRCEKELANLSLVRNLLDVKVARRRRNSRLPELADLLLAHPVVSLRMVARRLEVSPEGARKLILDLGSIIREVSGRKRYRVWCV